MARLVVALAVMLVAQAVILVTETCMAANPSATTMKVRFDAKFGSVYLPVDPFSGTYFNLNKDSLQSNSLATVWVVNGPQGSKIQLRARETTDGRCIWDTLITDIDGNIISQSHLVRPDTTVGIFTGPQVPSNPKTRSLAKVVELGTFTIAP